MAIIKTKDGSEFIIDDHFFDLLSQFNWRNKDGYASTTIGGKYLTMHRIIAGAVFSDSKTVVDHINGKKNDNRSCNLRKTNHSSNNQKREIVRERFRYIGVYKRSNRWVAEVNYDKKRITKYFKTEHEAARFYDENIVKYHGDNALTNKKILLELLSKLSDTIK